MRARMSKLNVVVLYDRWEEPEEAGAASTDKSPLTRTLDFREGGHETAAGEVPGEWSSRFEADYHVIEPDAQIVYSYVMYHDDVRLSVSMTTIELDAVDDGAATRVVFTEQGAYFEDGDAANASREEGTIGLLKQLEESL